jgi:hypothetical protein
MDSFGEGGLGLVAREGVRKRRESSSSRALGSALYLCAW